MAEHELLRSQKNAVFELVRESGLDPFNFEWGEADSRFIFIGVGRLRFPEKVECLRYKDSVYYYVFDFKDGKHYAFFTPGGEKHTESAYPGSWKNQLQYVDSWLGNMKREVHQPDLWEELAKYRLADTEGIDPSIENQPFTMPQIVQLTSGINAVREYLRMEFQSAEGNQRVINEKLDYLVDAASRQGRKDWFHTCIGVLFTLGVAVGLSPDQAEKAWSLIKSAIAGIIKLLPK